jgi:hypothetical protein
MHEPLAHKRKALGLPFYFFYAFSAFLGRLLDWCVETRRSREPKKKGTGSQHRHGSICKVLFLPWQLARATCVSSSPISPNRWTPRDRWTHTSRQTDSFQIHALCVWLVVITSITSCLYFRLFSKYIQHRRGKCKHHSVSLSVRTREHQISAQMWRSVFMINKTARRKASRVFDVEQSKRE